ncbi:metallophosphoesterase family protein [Candidatus Uabimicrobium amorphum]|uniref:2,3-bisphosphoglycerate-independentphosphoglycerate mutase n=1 Tax=Uabimicrobium amorphum TaxID=2596890 RepID=A0A5S9IHE5_UABAM|nr:metallophosphoesterase [Candidatus Uabimicrobium amorphum]BBM81823.1 2,3-bisphosphoglycerate-independentphosphoglycerate mutase [Candidatus Uabimicrobium amorphum]
MIQALWLTDIHLEFLEDDAFHNFLEILQQCEYDMLWITGDIAHGANVSQYLIKLAMTLQKPIYFVLGNHDFYGRKTNDVYEEMYIVSQNPYLTYLSASPVIEINANHALIGHDSWGDGRWGNYYASNITLNDFLVIRDFAGLDQEKILSRMQYLAHRSVVHIKKALKKALKKYHHIWMLSHVTPFKETCLYGNEIADDNWLPFFCCKEMGDMLIEVMSQHPQQYLTVLSGHTHNEAHVQISSNIHSIVGGAEYCEPCVQHIFTI